jgi:hypothetical protein
MEVDDQVPPVTTETTAEVLPADAAPEPASGETLEEPRPAAEAEGDTMQATDASASAAPASAAPTKPAEPVRSEEELFKEATIKKMRTVFNVFDTTGSNTCDGNLGLTMFVVRALSPKDGK